MIPRYGISIKKSKPVVNPSKEDISRPLTAVLKAGK